METKQLPPDFKDFFKILNRNKVRYLVSGSWALALHGWPRATRNIDIWVAIDSANADQLRKALAEFGAPGMIADDFFAEEKNIIESLPYFLWVSCNLSVTRSKASSQEAGSNFPFFLITDNR